MENTLNLVIMKRFRKLLPLLLVFPFIRGCHSVWCSSSASCFQCLSPLHQLSPYPPSLHLEIFSLASLFSSPNNSISITLLSTYSWSLLMTCSYHLSLPFLIFIPNFSTLTVPLMYSFLILFFLVTPIANLNIFIFATFISSTCFFVITTVLSPYTNWWSQH